MKIDVPSPLGETESECEREQGRMEAARWLASEQPVLFFNLPILAPNGWWWWSRWGKLIAKWQKMVEKSNLVWKMVRKMSLYFLLIEWTYFMPLCLRFSFFSYDRQYGTYAVCTVRNLCHVFFSLFLLACTIESIVRFALSHTMWMEFLHEKLPKEACLFFYEPSPTFSFGNKILRWNGDRRRHLCRLSRMLVLPRSRYGWRNLSFSPRRVPFILQKIAPFKCLLP